jgi:hypothetical protein
MDEFVRVLVGPEVASRYAQREERVEPMRIGAAWPAPTLAIAQKRNQRDGRDENEGDAFHGDDVQEYYAEISGMGCAQLTPSSQIRACMGHRPRP